MTSHEINGWNMYAFNRRHNRFATMGIVYTKSLPRLMCKQCQQMKKFIFFVILTFKFLYMLPETNKPLHSRRLFSVCREKDYYRLFTLVIR